MFATAIKDREFRLFRQLIYRIAGIDLSDSKKAMVGGRLAKRLRHYALTSYGDYFRLLEQGDRDELQVAVDLLTTNETYFFREPKHFDFLRERLGAMRSSGQPVRVWSAACSSGEEPYSIAIVLTQCLDATPWEVIGSDISCRVLDRARDGIYAQERMKGMPPHLAPGFFLKGVGSQAGKFQITPELRSRVRFMQINLNADLPSLGKFDFIFLRNVMIYFDVPTKKQVIARMLPLLKAEGHFLVGHSETLSNVVGGLTTVRPSVYKAAHRDERLRTNP